MKSTKARSRAEWRQIIDAWQDSGLGVRDFCKQNEVAEGSFYGWRQQLGFGIKNTGATSVAQKQSNKATIKFLPVQLTSPPTTKVGFGALTSERVEIFLDNGSMVRFSCEMSDEILSRIIKLAGARTC